MLTLINVRFQLMHVSDYVYNFIKKTFACDLRMSGVVLRINRHENPVIKLLVNFSCSEIFGRYGSLSDMKFAAVQMIGTMN